MITIDQFTEHLTNDEKKYLLKELCFQLGIKSPLLTDVKDYLISGDCGFSVRLYNALSFGISGFSKKHKPIDCFENLEANELLKIRGFGLKCLRELNEFMIKNNLKPLI